MDKSTNTATVRYSLKTIAFWFPEGSIERTYLHGKWQRQRGRNPSLLYGNHTDCGEAFVAAKLLLESYFDEIFKIPYIRQTRWNKRFIDRVRARCPVGSIYDR